MFCYHGQSVLESIHTYAACVISRKRFQDKNIGRRRVEKKAYHSYFFLKHDGAKCSLSTFNLFDDTVKPDIHR